MRHNFVKLFCFLALFATSALVVQGATIGYWEFEEQAPGGQATGTPGEIIDSSGNGHHGTAVGNPMPTYCAAPGPNATGITLDDITYVDSPANPDEDRIVIPHSTDFNLMLGNGDTNDYTIEAIVRMPERDPEEIVHSSPAIMTKRGSVGTGWSFRAGLDGKLDLYLEGTGLNFIYPNHSGNTDILDGEWHHVAVVIDTNADSALTSATFYVDGQADGGGVLNSHIYSGSWTNENIANTADVMIGDFNKRGCDQWVGDIDAVRFSTGILTPGEFLEMDVVPEPSVIAMLLIGAVGFGCLRRRVR